MHSFLWGVYLDSFGCSHWAVVVARSRVSVIHNKALRAHVQGFTRQESCLGSGTLLIKVFRVLAIVKVARNFLNLLERLFKLGHALSLRSKPKIYLCFFDNSKIMRISVRIFIVLSHFNYITNPLYKTRKRKRYIRCITLSDSFFNNIKCRFESLSSC